MVFELFKQGGFVTLVCGILAIVIAVLAQDARSTARALADHGQTASASVVDKHQETERRRSGSNGTRRTSTTYYLTYAFEAEAGDQRVEVSVPKDVYDGLTVGDVAEIRYLPEEPTNIEVYPGQVASTGTAMGLIAGVLGLVAAIAAGVAMLLTRRARQRFQTAREAPCRPARPSCAAPARPTGPLSKAS
jgi:hypothetical protein